jgi:F-type H+-transporting ATPase subunit b
VQIDYFTIIAQIINFLVLVFLLRHFLYRPVIKAMAEREQKIASSLQEAEQKKKDAEQEVEIQGKMLKELSDKRQEMIDKAEEEVKILRADLLRKAQDDVEKSKVDWESAVEQEKGALIGDLSRQEGLQVYAVARQVLRDLADEELESRIIKKFVKRLQHLEKAEKEEIKELFKTPGQQITVRSAFEIPEEMRHTILEAVKEQTEADVKMQFKTAPELISGVEMSAQDTRLVWSIASYLNALEADLSEVFEKKFARGRQAAGEGKENEETG